MQKITDITAGKVCVVKNGADTALFHTLTALCKSQRFIKVTNRDGLL